MRSLVRLQSTATAEYDHDWHRNQRSLVWNALTDTQYTDEHGDGTPGFSFSNPFPTDDDVDDPWKTIEEGEQRAFVFAATREDLLAKVVKDLLNTGEIRIGEMTFDVVGAEALDPDVGPEGTRGVLTTGTGVLSAVPEHHKSDNRNHPTDEGTTYWTTDYPVGAFSDHIEWQLQRQWDRFGPRTRPGPAEVDGDLFDEWQLTSMYGKNVDVSVDTERYFPLSKWRLHYRVRDDLHREHLNLALDSGIGSRTTMGFGFLNKEVDG